MQEMIRNSEIAKWGGGGVSSLIIGIVAFCGPILFAIGFYFGVRLFGVDPNIDMKVVTLATFGSYALAFVGLGIGSLIMQEQEEAESGMGR